MSAHRITIQEAVRLTGKSRRTLYRDMAAGRLSYQVGDNDRREVVVSELIRAYGALKGEPAPDDAGANAGGLAVSEDGAIALLADLLEEMRQQSRTLEAQREELAALRQEVAELRSLPAPGGLAHHERLAADQTPETGQRQKAAPPPKRGAPGSGLNFGDLIARMEERQRH